MAAKARKKALDANKPQGSGINLGPNRNIFYVAFLFLTSGLVAGSIYDFAIGAAVPVILSDVTASIGFMLVQIAVRAKKVDYGLGLVIMLSITLAVFYLGMFFTFERADHAPRWSVYSLQNLLLTGLIGAICALSYDRRAAIYFAISGVSFQIFVLIFSPRSQYFNDQIVTNAFVLIGTLMVVYYYRRRLEQLVAEISGSLKQTRLLKDRADQYNEINRPFVVFGRNAAGLAADFKTDVEILKDITKRLRDDFEERRLSDQDDLIRMETAVRGLNQRIAWVKYATSATDERIEESISMRDVVESALYPFAIIPEITTQVDFFTEFEDEGYTWGKRGSYLRIVEALIRAASDSILLEPEKFGTDATVAPRRRSVSILVEENAGLIQITISFRGKPFKICEHCLSESCGIDCPALAARSNGDDGLMALQALSFHNSLRILDARLRLKSEKELNIVRVFFPRRSRPADI